MKIGRWQLVCEVLYPGGYPREPFALTLSDANSYLDKEKKENLRKTFSDLLSESVVGSVNSSESTLMGAVIKIMENFIEEVKQDDQKKVGQDLFFYSFYILVDWYRASHNEWQ